MFDAERRGLRSHAERGNDQNIGQGWPTVTTLGTVPERRELSVEKPGRRARFFFGYFLFRASQEKVTRRKGESSTGEGLRN